MGSEGRAIEAALGARQTGKASPKIVKNMFTVILGHFVWVLVL